MAMSERDRRAMLVGVGVVLAAVIYRVVLSPLVTAAFDARQTVAERSALVSRVASQVDRRDAIHAHFAIASGRRLTNLYQRSTTCRSFSRSWSAMPLTRAGAGRLGGCAGCSQTARRARGVAAEPAGQCRGQRRCDPRCARRAAHARHVVILDSIDLTMAQPGNREKWTMALQVSTPVLEVAQP